MFAEFAHRTPLLIDRDASGMPVAVYRLTTPPASAHELQVLTGGGIVLDLTDADDRARLARLVDVLAAEHAAAELAARGRHQAGLPT